jgi:nitrate reductase delta subunit
MQPRTRAAGDGARTSDEAMLAALQRESAWFEARTRLKAWTRERFALAAGDLVEAGEVASELPGCPPRETRIEFWTTGGVRHHFKVFKPLDAVTLEDIPPAWLRDALAVPEGLECDCC